METKGTAKLNTLLSIENAMQTSWEEVKLFDEDAANDDKPKYFVNWPYPYMNGRLHLGHAFSLTKCEFAVGFRRLLGERTIWPFGLHCTGMPIKACADKLKYEMETFGCPPVFPKDDSKLEKNANNDRLKVGDEKAKGKKSKLVAKSGSFKYQWQIMKSLGLSDKEIVKFSDPNHWLNYFPPLCITDLKKLGVKVDWRRSFVTTDVNPYYDSFVRWHMRTLKSKNKIKFGKRNCVYSPSNNQPCMDHDRSSGEGVGPQEYTLIKMTVQKPYPQILKPVEDRKVYLAAATLRPETMYGQTNCWVHPTIEYLVYEMKNGDIFVTTERAAKNLAYQLHSKQFGVVDRIKAVGKNGLITGNDLIGTKLSAPNAVYETIFVLPMLSIKKDKGTGVVTSVPSDSPDDFAALQDLKKKQAFREKYSLTDEMVLPFDPVPIIDIPDYGTLSAPSVCQTLKIQSQNDTDKLAEAKERVYLKGFYEGVMVIGSHKGEKVQNVKKLIQNEMLESNLAILYYEPEKPVISRSGDDCVVALVDQWFLDYGNEQWTAEALECLRKMDMYSDEARHSFEKSLEWLQDWSCSRTYGLGTRLPWDEQYLVESLSDSTIYMAYYTIVHFLQGDIRGSTPGLLNIRADQLNDEIWDYIFLNASLPKKLNGLSVDALDKMKKEFTYWYGFDLRTSGKDLIPNHLSLCIFNHVAIWNNDSSKWPKSFLATGHLMLNSEKMSKSTGNFMTLNDATLRYSADGTRFALADGGDGIEDANFVEATANAAILRLFNWLDWVKDFVDNVDRYENRQLTRSINWNDKVLAHEMQRQIARTQAAYERMMFKEALKSGFFELQQALSRYKEMIGGQENMERNLIMKFIEVQTILLAPLCPHICDYIWLNVLRHETSLMAYHIKRWPQVRDYDNSMIDAADYVCSAVHDFRLKRLAHMNPKTSKKSGASMAPLEKPTHATIWVAKTYPSWQLSILELLNKNLTKLPNGKFLLPENKEISKMLKELSLGKFMKKAMPFVALVKGNLEKSGIGALKTASPFCELTALTSNLEYIRASLDLEGVDVCYSSESEENFIKEETCPSEPKIKFRTDKALKISLINPQCMSGLFSTDLPVYDGDRLAEIERRLIQQNRIIKSRVESRESNLVYYYFDEEASSRKIPVFGENIGKSKVNTNDKLIVSMEKDAILINGISVGCKLVYVLATTD